MKSAIIYSSIDGQTKKICEVIKENLINNSEHELISIENSSKLNIENYDCIIIGASIRYGKHSSKVMSFVKKNINLIKKQKTVFFSVNVVARKKEKNLPETNPYIIKFLKQTQWVPSHIGVFAGKVEYPKYGFFDKYTIRFIMWLTKGPTDITQSYEFTDWKAVESFSSLISS